MSAFACPPLQELYPEVRELVIDFNSSRYTRCLSTLEVRGHRRPVPCLVSPTASAAEGTAYMPCVSHCLRG